MNPGALGFEGGFALIPLLFNLNVGLNLRFN